MNAQTIAAIRIFIMLLGGFFVGKGWVSKETLDTITDPVTLTAIIGGIGAAVAAGSAIYSRRPHGIIQDAAALPQVDAVVVKQKTANEIPASNVVGSVEEAESVVPALAAHKAARKPAAPHVTH